LLLAAVHSGAAEVTPRTSEGCHAASIETGRQLRRTIVVDGTERSYILDVPDRVKAQVPVPLLLDFHGFGHSAEGVWKVSGFKDIAARDGFITAYPDGLPVNLLGREDSGWQIFSADGNRDLAFTTRLLDQLERTYCIDLARVFATGFSNGAFFSNILACTMSDRFAAVAPVSGGRLTVPCTPQRPVPVLIQHGRQDQLLPVEQAHQERDAWVQTDGCRVHSSDGCDHYRDCRAGAEVTYCEGDHEHHWPPEATQRVWDFFLAHPMAAAAAPAAAGSRPGQAQ